MSKRRYDLSVFSLTLITVVSVDSIRNLPTTALFGSQLVVFFIMGALFFLIPTALVSAELSSGWPKQGGVYIWVKEAFGKPVGFLAIWLQWIENVIWYPALLSFVAGTIGYLFHPSLAEDPHFLMAVIVISFWGATYLNCRGMRFSALFSDLCAIFGLLIPMALIISLGAYWLVKGNPIHIHFSVESMMPHWNDSSLWVSLTAIILSFCGIEIATVHAQDVEDPQHAFPRALAYAVMIILGTLVFASLAIAIVLPHNEISLVAGIMQAVHAYFVRYHLLWMMPLVAVMLVLGGLGSVSNWIIAPTKGLLVAAEEGNLPAICKMTNDKDAPIFMLLAQAIIVTVLSALYLFMPSVNGSYWFLTALATQLYMLMYILMFLAAIQLRRKAGEVPRPFRIPGGNWGLYVVSTVGILGAFLTLCVSFIPPTGIDVGHVQHYEALLIGGLILMCLPPFICLYWEKCQGRKCRRQ